MTAVARIQYPVSSKRVVGFSPRTRDGHMVVTNGETAAMGQGPHVAEEAGDGAPGRV